MSRKTAREVAMKIAFSQLLGGENSHESVLEQSGIAEQPTKEDFLYSEQIVQGIHENLEQIDAWIAASAIGWEIERMAKVDLCILRIAVYEMFFCEDIPCSVSINEAVELAKRFGGDRSSAYINGILGTLAKKKDTDTEAKETSEPEETAENDQGSEADETDENGEATDVV